MGKKSYIQKTRELLLELRRCEIYDMISGYQETKGWYDGRTTYIIHGNPGCEDWFRRLADISRIGKMWGLNEEEHHFGIMKREEDFHQLTRRFGRYKKMRIDALMAIRDERVKEQKPEEYAGWEEVHARVLQMIEASCYDPEVEGNNSSERKGKRKIADYYYYGKKTTAKGG